jgi:hypothetical protein
MWCGVSTSRTPASNTSVQDASAYADNGAVPSRTSPIDQANLTSIDTTIGILCHERHGALKDNSAKGALLAYLQRVAFDALPGTSGSNTQFSTPVTNHDAYLATQKRTSRETPGS